jgi:hypothetical protein
MQQHSVSNSYHHHQQQNTGESYQSSDEAWVLPIRDAECVQAA